MICFAVSDGHGFQDVDVGKKIVRDKLHGANNLLELLDILFSSYLHGFNHLFSTFVHQIPMPQEGQDQHKEKDHQRVRCKDLRLEFHGHPVLHYTTSLHSQVIVFLILHHRVLVSPCENRGAMVRYGTGRLVCWQYKEFKGISNRH